jgi:hypothetical protein
MALPDLAGQNIETTYQRIVHTDGTNYYNGAGTLLNIGGGGSAFPYTGNAVISGSLLVSSSLMVTGSLDVSGSITAVTGYLLGVSGAGIFPTSSISSPSSVNNPGIYIRSSTLPTAYSSLISDCTIAPLLPAANSQLTRVTLNLPSGFAPANGTGQWRAIQLQHTINQAGGASGVTHGIFINPTLTSAYDYRALGLNNSSGTGIYQFYSGVKNFFGGNVGIGTGKASPSVSLDINGDALITGSLNVTNGITGSLFGTASFAVSSSRAVSSSFATTASYAVNGGVTKIIAGTNVTISPANGLGQVTINSSGGGGSTFPYTGSAKITGSLEVTGPVSVLGFDAIINGVTVGTGQGNDQNNTALGNGALGAGPGQGSNIAVGAGALSSLTDGGKGNVALGTDTLRHNSIGDYNIAIGGAAGINNTEGYNNILIGARAGRYITTGFRNILIGDDNVNYPDHTTFNGQNTLSISKGDTALGTGLPHIWAPDTINVDLDTSIVLITVKAANYSSMFVEYTIEDTNGSLRAGYIKGVWKRDLSKIKWTEDTTDSIGDTSKYIFDIYNAGSENIGLRLTNTDAYYVYCNVTSRLLARPYNP